MVRVGVAVPDGQVVEFRSLDGLRLVGDLCSPERASGTAAVLVHGGGVDRHEAGFFDRLAAGLADAGISSLRFDLRGHGQSAGRQEDLTLASVLNDIGTAIDFVREATDAPEIALIGQSFGGGICAYLAAKRPQDVQRLVLLCPQLDYLKRTVTSRAYWKGGHLDPEASASLAEAGFIQHSPTFRHGRAIYNEVFWLRPDEVLEEIQAPTLIVHGSADTIVPIVGSLAAERRLGKDSRLMVVDGAQHGFAVDGDPTYLNPQSQAWQAEVIDAAAEWCGEAKP